MCPIAPDPVSNIVLTFDTAGGVFDSASQLLTTVVNVTWEPPARLNGPNVTYFLDIRHATDADIVHIATVFDEATSATVSIRPFEMYQVTVVAANDVGNSSVASIVARSPEAGERGTLGAI